ncbi:MAG: hypothetical protein A3F46_06115 [Legionellales bacterium RIFCSPHIGHO2_12_FULL_42_9]|nr:MAG: hypothetical protein A3F46_06115 [Legionellales bacterium RIFCSPHIGHO2_12_FULL_42_9]
MKNRIMMMCLLLGVGAVAFGQDNAPSSCRPLPVTGESIMLNVKKPVLILLHNVSDGDLWITHPVADPGASAGFTSHLMTKKWSALVVDKKSLELNCIESKPGHEQQISCEGQLAVCKWPIVKIAPKQLGTYWAAENMNWSDLTTYLGGRGFSLPASTKK